MSDDLTLNVIGQNNSESCAPGTLGNKDTRKDLLSLLPTLEFPADPKLVAEGWERRFMADPARVKEATRTYTELGFEVRTEIIKPDELHEVCGACRLATCHAYVTLYTRK
ncbi:MAG: hypothetical protein GY805_37110 [Chloroflexi bacterium]|nr:hypothetical protein [Chloroflexota bacterium]